MNHRTRTSSKPAPRRSGFTLVEMLVAVTLVVLMLLLFAQIFGDTVRIMREQQSLAQNDQKARSVETILRDDLMRASFRQPRVKGVSGIVPLRSNWPIDPERQRGYLYYSENEIENDGDDTLQFTIDGRVTTRIPGVESYRGRAAQLGANTFSPGAPGADINQPDWDDGNFGDNVGESHAAEVAYFLRGGNLYRRRLLLREPIKPFVTGAPSEYDAQPGPGPFGAEATGSPTTLYTRKFVRDLSGAWIDGDYSATLDLTVTPGNADFWNDFDYSAWNWWRDNNDNGILDNFVDGVDQYWLMFNGVNSLKNMPGAHPFPIALPQHRFGHRPPVSSALPTANLIQGQPVEYLLTPGGAWPRRRPIRGPGPSLVDTRTKKPRTLRSTIRASCPRMAQAPPATPC